MKNIVPQPFSIYQGGVYECRDCGHTFTAVDRLFFFLRKKPVCPKCKSRRVVKVPVMR